jgi:hypothetical protein
VLWRIEIHGAKERGEKEKILDWWSLTFTNERSGISRVCLICVFVFFLDVSIPNWNICAWARNKVEPANLEIWIMWTRRFWAGPVSNPGLSSSLMSHSLTWRDSSSSPRRPAVKRRNWIRIIPEINLPSKRIPHPAVWDDDKY